MRPVPAARRGAVVLVVASLVVLPGCLTAVEEVAKEMLGEEEWRPADPTQEDYLVRTETGFLAPHAFGFDGTVRTATVSGLRMTATTDAFTLTDILAEVDRQEVVVPPDTADGADAGGDADPDRMAGNAYGQEDGHLRLLLLDANGTLETDDGTVALTGKNLLVEGRLAPLRLQGDMMLSTLGRTVLDGTEAHIDPVGYPLRLFTADPEGRPTEAWHGEPLAIRLDAAATATDVTVAWSEEDPEHTADGQANGTLRLDAGQRLVAGAPSVRFTPSALDVGDPEQARHAAGGYRTTDPVGFLRLSVEGGTGTLDVRQTSLEFDRGVLVHVAHMDRFVLQDDHLMAEGTLVQLEEGTRPWLEAQVDVAHPARDSERPGITLRVPPGETFQTMVGVREVSGVGSVMAVQAEPVAVPEGAEVTIADRWSDDRVLRHSAVGAFADAFARIFVTPDGRVDIGPEAVAYLPMSFELPNGTQNETTVDIRFTSRNAAPLTVTFTLVPDADAGTSDVRTDTPTVGLVPLLVALLALVALVARRRS